jgi:hypothetical protein
VWPDLIPESARHGVFLRRFSATPWRRVRGADPSQSGTRGFAADRSLLG